MSAESKRTWVLEKKSVRLGWYSLPYCTTASTEAEARKRLAKYAPLCGEWRVRCLGDQSGKTIATFTLPTAILR